MRGWRRDLRAALVVLAAAHCGCAMTPGRAPTLALEQHTLRIPLTLDADGVVSLAEHQPLVGRMDLRPILEAEGIPLATSATTVQGMMHYGRFYVVADGFRAIWEITPEPGTPRASYRPIPLVTDAGAAPLQGVRLSRYGPNQSSCLRVDSNGGDAVFVNPRGEAHGDCP